MPFENKCMHLRDGNGGDVDMFVEVHRQNVRMPALWSAAAFYGAVWGSEVGGASVRSAASGTGYIA